MGGGGRWVPERSTPPPCLHSNGVIVQTNRTCEGCRPPGGEVAAETIAAARSSSRAQGSALMAAAGRASALSERRRPGRGNQAWPPTCAPCAASDGLEVEVRGGGGIL